MSRLIIIDDGGLAIATAWDTSLGAQRSGVETATFAYSESNRRITVSSITGNGGYQSRAYRSRNSGKFYYEIQVIAEGNVSAFGWYTNTTAANQDVSGATNLGTSAAWAISDARSGNWQVGATFASGTLSSVGARTYMFAVDWSAGKLWIGSNGSWQGGGDPAAGTGALCTGASFAAGSPGLTQRGGFGTCDARLNSAASEMTYGIPSGFVAYSTA